MENRCKYIILAINSPVFQPSPTASSDCVYQPVASSYPKHVQDKVFSWPTPPGPLLHHVGGTFHHRLALNSSQLRTISQQSKLVEHNLIQSLIKSGSVVLRNMHFLVGRALGTYLWHHIFGVSFCIICLSILTPGKINAKVDKAWLKPPRICIFVLNPTMVWGKVLVLLRETYKNKLESSFYILLIPWICIHSLRLT